MRPVELHFANYLNKLKEQSQCLDKQVACIIVDKQDRIVSQGINEIIKCDKKCHDKENRICVVRHAEIVAIRNLRPEPANPGSRTIYQAPEFPFAYINLFPCVPCQKELAHIGIQEIVVFGPRHKDQWFKNIRLEPDIFAELAAHNGRDKQLSVAQGELAELITSISDYFYRPDKFTTPHDLADEIIDAELMIDQVKKLLWENESETYNIIRELRIRKFVKLLQSIDEGDI